MLKKLNERTSRRDVIPIVSLWQVGITEHQKENGRCLSDRRVRLREQKPRPFPTPALPDPDASPAGPIVASALR